jgi:uncharacterized membrane protein YcaP (DUF421 family)
MSGRAATPSPSALVARELLGASFAPTDGMFFHSWTSIGEVVLASATVFLIVVAMLRFVGQRALAKMSGFDVVFTVTLGSVIATAAISRDVAVVDAIAALLTLLALQEIIRYLQSRSLRVHHAVRERPDVLLWDGELLEDRLRQTSISADEVRAAVRKAGLRSLSEARAVVLENDGDWSVIPKREGESDESAFYGLPIPGRPGNSPAEDGDRATPTHAHRLP